MKGNDYVSSGFYDPGFQPLRFNSEQFCLSYATNTSAFSNFTTLVQLHDD